MTEELIARHNAVVRPDDTVIDVGDFSMDSRLVEPMLKRFHGKRTLVVGNHDRCHPCHSRAAKWTRQYLEWGFERVVQSLDMEVGGYVVRIEHMPYVQDERHGERYAEFRPKDDGRYLFCGHVHQLFKQRGREINVGVDVWQYRPVHVDELAALLVPRGSPSEHLPAG
jgi:calcineurin-like phosphoesterase family protein